VSATIAAATKAYLSSNGERHQGKAIDNLVAEVRSLKDQIVGLQDRLKKLIEIFLNEYLPGSIQGASRRDRNLETIAFSISENKAIVFFLNLAVMLPWGELGSNDFHDF
jgi:hypothetical protein